MIDSNYNLIMYGVATGKMSKIQMVNFVKKISKDLGLPEDLALAVAQTESSFEHWRKDGTLKANDGGDYGLMQINIYAHPDAFKSKNMDIKNNWQHNAIYGLTYLKLCYTTALKAGYIGDELFKATYSMYNSGRCNAYKDPTAAGHQDVKIHVDNFWGVYTQRKWEQK